MAAVKCWIGIACPRFLVFKNGADHRLHISANPAAVVCEYRGNARYVSGTRIARDKMLNELFADERTDVGMVKDVGKRTSERSCSAVWPDGSTVPLNTVFDVVSCCASTATIGAR